MSKKINIIAEAYGSTDFRHYLVEENVCPMPGDRDYLVVDHDEILLAAR